MEVVIEALPTDPAVLRELETFISPLGLLVSALESGGLLGLLFSTFFARNGLLRFKGLKGNNLYSFRGFLGLSGFSLLHLVNYGSLFFLDFSDFVDLLDRYKGAVGDLLSDLVLLAGLYLSEDSVAASRLRALSEYSRIL